VRAAVRRRAEKGSLPSLRKATRKSRSEKRKRGGRRGTPVVSIDFDGISQRILALPVPAANYAGIEAGKTGEVFLLEQALIPPPDEFPPKLAIHRFRLEDREAEKLLEDVTAFDLSANGEKMLYKLEDKWMLAGTGSRGPEAAEELALEAMEVYVDPPAEWRQMYRETWRIERDFLYDPASHGLDLAAASEKYEGFLERVSSREDLNYLFTEMLGELTLGHVFVGGRRFPRPGKRRPPRRRLHRRERSLPFRAVFSGELEPESAGALTQPGVDVTPATTSWK
jgi:tricorn protease